MNKAALHMNDRYHLLMSGVLNNAERDLRLASAGGDPSAIAKAQARYDTIQAALEIYAAAHKHAYGERPRPRAAQAKP